MNNINERNEGGIKNTEKKIFLKFENKEKIKDKLVINGWKRKEIIGNKKREEKEK